MKKILLLAAVVLLLGACGSQVNTDAPLGKVEETIWEKTHHRENYKSLETVYFGSRDMCVMETIPLDGKDIVIRPYSFSYDEQKGVISLYQLGDEYKILDNTDKTFLNEEKRNAINYYTKKSKEELEKKMPNELKNKPSKEEIQFKINVKTLQILNAVRYNIGANGEVKATPFSKEDREIYDNLVRVK